VDTGEGLPDDDATDGTCSDFDAWQARCTALETERDCGGDPSCQWDQSACAKDVSYDANNCAQYNDATKCAELGGPGVDGVVAPGCFWDDSTSAQAACVVSDAESTESVCGSLTETECNAATAQECEWIVIGDAGGDVQCPEFDTEAECEAAEDDASNKACEWDEDAAGGGVGGGDPVKCGYYDVCPTLQSQSTCEERLDACDWKTDTCQSNSVDDAIGGCSFVDNQAECEAMAPSSGVQGGEGTATTDDDVAEANPMCLWRQFTADSCTYENSCADNTEVGG
jgi:hypothetical protein